MSQSNEASNYALNHQHHRQRLRDIYQKSHGAAMTDITMLELLYNGYYTRNETNAIARERLSVMPLSQIIPQTVAKQWSDLSAEERYVNVCGRIMYGKNHFETLPQDWYGLRLEQEAVWFEKIYPSFLSELPRMIYLGFDNQKMLRWAFFCQFGESELPIALTHCHLRHLKSVVLCLSADGVEKDVFYEGVNYYLKKISYCPRIWMLAGLLIRNGEQYRYIRIQDDTKEDNQSHLSARW